MSLHYPKSIAKAVSLAETTELALRRQEDPAGNQVHLEIRAGPHKTKIWGEAHGVVEAEEVAAVEVQWDLVDEGQEEEETEDDEEEVWGQ